MWTKLTADGGEAGRCGWLKDKFGLSGRSSPIRWAACSADKDGARAKRVIEAMMQMDKLDRVASAGVRRGVRPFEAHARGYRRPPGCDGSAKHPTGRAPPSPGNREPEFVRGEAV